MKKKVIPTDSHHSKGEAAINHDHFIVPPGKKIRLKDYDPGFTAHYKNKDEAAAKLRKDVKRLAKYQDVLYAQNIYALLVVLQAMDTAGKDGTIRHVMSGVNPQGTQVHSFKGPSAEELGHDFLWRHMKALPERGGIGIFNRSYYEEVLVVRVHPENLDRQRLPSGARGKGIWKHRFDAINNFEKYLVRNGIVVLKFFLHLSKEEQKRRFLARINTPEKNWKFFLSDVKERAYWDDYMNAFEDTLNHTSTEHAPWYIVPADSKWFTRAVVADVIVEKLKSLKLRYPSVSKKHRQRLLEAKELLEKERS
jgi:PPK2 family polyphosphate:nucleotide phosphotransferase